MAGKEGFIEYTVYRDIADKEQLGELAETISVCIVKAFGNEMPQDEVDSELKGTFLIIAQTPDGKVVGYGSLHRKKIGDSSEHYSISKYTNKELEIYSLSALAVDADYQRRGIAKVINSKVFDEAIKTQPIFVSTTTQNPGVEKSICSVLDDLVKQGKLLGYSIDRNKLPRFYGRSLTGYPLSYEGTPFEDLNQNEGDAFSLVFELSYEN